MELSEMHSRSARAVTNKTPEDVAKLIHQKATEDNADGRMEFYLLMELLLPKPAIARVAARLPAAPGPQKPVEDYLSKVERNLNSVVMIVPESAILKAKGADNVLIWSEPLKIRRVSLELEICGDTLFADQPSAFSRGTGFFVKKDVIATAAHVLIDAKTDISKMRFVHGVVNKKSGDFARHIIVHKSKVYRPVFKAGSLPAGDFELSADNADWSLVRVAPAFPRHLPQPGDEPSVAKCSSKRATADMVKAKTVVYGIGHGLGLPVKILFDGHLKKEQKRGKSYFECTSTLLGGNSGSPVFYANDHSVAGIYVRGIKKLVKHDKKECLVVKNDQAFYDHSAEAQECQAMKPVLAALKRF